MLREIVKIDEELCNGCGDCIPNCHEGALQLIDGKVRLISELMCDGLGACIGHCPQNALTTEYREAEDYNETEVIAGMIDKGKGTVFAHLKHLQDHNEKELLHVALNYIKEHKDQMPFKLNEVHELLHAEQKHDLKTAPSSGCPGSSAYEFSSARLHKEVTYSNTTSELSQWPVQLHLINPLAGYFKHADVLLSADCVAHAYGGFHQILLKSKRLAIACPKLDQNMELYVHKIMNLINEACVHTITVAIMEVPCCSGLIKMVKLALSQSNRKLPIKVVVIGIKGDIISEHEI